MNKLILVTGGVLGFLAIILGAFGAHFLKELLSANALETFETGVKYQIYHALLLLIIGGSSNLKLRFKKVFFVLTISGIILFSGSIYGLATNILTPFDFKNIAFLTPVGGLLLIISWLILIIDFLKMKS